MITRFRLLLAHRRAWLISALGAVLALVVVGSVFAALAASVPAVIATATPTPSMPSAIAAPTPTPTVTPSPTPSVPAQQRTCSIATLANDPRLRQFQGYVMNAATGEMLFDRGGATPSRPGSVVKLLTASAAVAALGPGYRIQTRVVATPGTIALVGGGDPTLSALPEGQESFYRGAPKLAVLAREALAKYRERFPDVPITAVVIDASLWDPADRWDPSVSRKEQTIGYASETTALQVDGDRANPKANTSPRSTDPIGRAGAAFAAALGLAVAPTIAAAPAGAVELASVLSQPVQVLIKQMLMTSDNTLAEHLARLVSLAVGSDGSAASLARVIPDVLRGYGLDTSGVAVRDGSGESELNAVSPSFVSRLMVKIAAGGQNLNVVYAGLPVSGKSGSLASRFTGANAIARGAVVAKTGWLETAYTLAGVVHAQDGSTLAFAFYAIRPAISASAKAALDTLTTGVFTCGNNLAN